MSNSDNESLEQIVPAHLAEMLRFAIRLTGRPETAEEVVQEAIVRAVRSWHGFRHTAEAKTWLKRIIINVFRDSVGERPAVESIDMDMLDRREATPADQAMAGELGRLIAARVSALPPRQREVLVLLTYEGLSVEEVAKMLEIRTSNVYATLHAARRTLRIALASYLGEAFHEK